MDSRRPFSLAPLTRENAIDRTPNNSPKDNPQMFALVVDIALASVFPLYFLLCRRTRTMLVQPLLCTRAKLNSRRMHRSSSLNRGRSGATSSCISVSSALSGTGWRQATASSLNGASSRCSSRSTVCKGSSAHRPVACIQSDLIDRPHKKIGLPAYLRAARSL